MKLRMMALLAFGVIAFGACKKNDEVSTKSKLTGTWKFSQYADDSNGNGSRDASELRNFADIGASGKISFNSNSTGTSYTIVLGDTLNHAFAWELTNSDTWIKITDKDAGISFGEVNYSNIESISSSTLILKDTTGGISWEIFTK